MFVNIFYFSWSYYIICQLYKYNRPKSNTAYYFNEICRLLFHGLCLSAYKKNKRLHSIKTKSTAVLLLTETVRFIR